MAQRPTYKKQLVMEVRIYRFLSILFAFFGLLIFVVLFLNNMEGRILASLTELYTLLIVIFPFVPAILLSIMAKNAEKKYLNYNASPDKTES